MVLNDLLKLTKEQIAITKVRLNTVSAGVNPIDEFKKDPKNLLNWNYWNNKSYKVGQISIGLVNMGNGKWLLFTVGKITGILGTPYGGDGNQGVQVTYDTLNEYNDLYGRVIVYYANKSQQMFRNASSILDELVVVEYLPALFSGFDFPGYDNVCLSYSELKTIVDGNYPSYHNALERQKAVYLQTDKATGKLYVGSATSNNGMLLARWSSYVKNGHGGNIGLQDLIKDKGFDYIKTNFQYTILENFNEKVDDKYVLERENYWKEVFKSRNFGYNKN